MQLLIQEFPDDSRNVMIDEQASGAAFSSFSQREGRGLYTYYCRTEGLLKRIHGRDQVCNTVLLSPAEKQLLKDTIMKFILGFKNLDLQIRVVEYRTNPTPSLYGASEFAESAVIFTTYSGTVTGKLGAKIEKERCPSSAGAITSQIR